MAVTAKKLFTPALLTASAATYYTVPANNRTIIKKLTFTNNDAVARAVTVYLVTYTTTADTSNILIKTHSIGAGQTYECYEAEGHTLNDGDFIQALADSAGVVNIQCSGVEIV